MDNIKLGDYLLFGNTTLKLARVVGNTRWGQIEAIHEDNRIRNHPTYGVEWVLPLSYTPVLTDFERSRIPYDEYTFDLLDGQNIRGTTPLTGQNIRGTTPVPGDFLSVTIKGVSQSVLVYVKDMTNTSYCCVELGGSFSIVDSRMICDSKKIYLVRGEQ